MSVDDHAIDSLRVWFDIEIEQLKEEWESGEYTKLSECPSFDASSAYREALNVLIKALYLPEYVNAFKIPPLKALIKESY